MQILTVKLKTQKKESSKGKSLRRSSQARNFVPSRGLVGGEKQIAVSSGGYIFKKSKGGFFSQPIWRPTSRSGDFSLKKQIIKAKNSSGLPAVKLHILV